MGRRKSRRTCKAHHMRHTSRRRMSYTVRNVLPISLKSFTVELPGMSTASRIPPTSPPFQAGRTCFTHRARRLSRTSCAWMTYTRRCSITSAKAHSSCSVSAMHLPKNAKSSSIPMLHTYSTTVCLPRTPNRRLLCADISRTLGSARLREAPTLSKSYDRRW